MRELATKQEMSQQLGLPQQPLAADRLLQVLGALPLMMGMPPGWWGGVGPSRPPRGPRGPRSVRGSSKAGRPIFVKGGRGYTWEGGKMKPTKKADLIKERPELAEALEKAFKKTWHKARKVSDKRTKGRKVVPSREFEVKRRLKSGELVDNTRHIPKSERVKGMRDPYKNKGRPVKPGQYISNRTGEDYIRIRTIVTKRGREMQGMPYSTGNWETYRILPGPKR